MPARRRPFCRCNRSSERRFGYDEKRIRSARRSWADVRRDRPYSRRQPVGGNQLRRWVVRGSLQRDRRICCGCRPSNGPSRWRLAPLNGRRRQWKPHSRQPPVDAIRPGTIRPGKGIVGTRPDAIGLAARASVIPRRADQRSIIRRSPERANDASLIYPAASEAGAAWRTTSSAAMSERNGDGGRLRGAPRHVRCTARVRNRQSLAGSWRGPRSQLSQRSVTNPLLRSPLTRGDCGTSTRPPTA
jgi:hypothetical protein